MHPAPILKMIRPFDPMDVAAEEHYDTVVRRLNRVRARRAGLNRERTELERQFVENDLRVVSGARRGEALSSAGRRRRLSRLVDLEIQCRQLASEERFAVEALDRMNEALDRWARETYAPEAGP
jgi:hypothetical protein